MALRLKEAEKLSERFALLHALGKSDAGETWLALDEELGDRVAVKVLDPENECPLEVLGKQIEQARSLVHPRIIRHQGVFTTDQHRFFVSRYIKSARVLDYAAHHRTHLLSELVEIVSALDYAHSLGLSHGSIEKRNILVDDAGHLHLSNFGITSYTSRAGPGSFQSPQIVAGQPPEPRDDIFSVGCMLFEIFTGQPFSAQHFSEQLSSAQTGPTSGSEPIATSSVPREVQFLLRKMLSPSAYDRPSNLSSCLEALGRVIKPTDVIATAIGATSFDRATRPSAPLPASNYRLPRERHVVSMGLAMGVFALIVLLGAGLFYVLPQEVTVVSIDDILPRQTQVAETAPQPTRAAEEQPAELSPYEIARTQHLKDESRELAAQLLRQQLYLEDHGLALWDPIAFQTVQQLADDGDDLFRDHNYAESIATFESGIVLLEQLEQQIQPTKEANLVLGEQTLVAADFEAAMNAFTIVVAIEPLNEAGQEGLRRAQQLETVLALMHEGLLEEDEGHLEAALESYNPARALDDKWQPARVAVGRVKRKITERNFNEAMSSGFASLSGGDFDAAKTAFNQAQEMLPDSGEPADGLHQVDLAIRTRAIAEHKNRASEFESNELWSEATDEYQAVIDLDPSLLFASDGKQNAMLRAEADKQLNYYLSNPVVLADDDELSKAKQQFYAATRVSKPGPILRKQMRAISKSIELARVPISVKIVSDTKTDIVVYRVGSLGRLQSTQIELYPGKYTVVGKRRGYRDVRREFTVLAGNSIEPIFVACTEKI